MYMEAVTCRELGGSCDQSLLAESWVEMAGTMTHHVTEIHPDTVKQMEQMAQ